MRSKGPLVLLLSLWLAGPVAGDSSLEARVARLERILASEGPSELLLQVQRLQQEVQALRGLVESQQYSLDRLQRQQRDQYLDIDARLGNGPESPPPGGPDTAGPEAYDRSAGDWISQHKTASRDGAGPAPPAESGSRGVPSLPSPETTTGDERLAYQNAFDLLKQRRYDEAIAAFNDLLRGYPQGEYTSDALFWLGETYYVTRDYDAAITQYDRLIAGYPESARLPSAMLKVGYIHDEQDRDEAARTVLEEIALRYPNSTEARLANDRLRRMEREPR